MALAVSCFLPAGQRGWKQLQAKSGLAPFSAEAAPDAMQVHFFEVGKADAILVSLQGQYALIDTGTYENGKDVVVWIEQLGVEELSYLFLSHPDSDHIGGAARVLETVPVCEVIEPEIPPLLNVDSEEWRSKEAAADRAGTQTRFAEAGDVFELGEAVFTVLSPRDSYVNVNDYSLVVMLEYGEVRILFCGDMEGRAERLLCDGEAALSADVLKVAHHGSATSSTDAFLDAVSPTYAVISTGPDRNNLPKNEVLLRLEEREIETFRTDWQGWVCLRTDGTTIDFETKR